MPTLRLLLALALVGGAFSNSTTPSSFENNHSENSEGAKDPLSIVNDSASDLNNSSLIVKESLAKVLDFYNTELLAASWGNFSVKLTQGCQKNVGAYIEGLRKAEVWALKMDDASGRYSTGWFWGNTYWTGSQNLCEHIAPKKHVIINSQNHSRVTRAADASVKPGIIVLVGSSATGPMTHSSGPPFPISFFMLRLLVNSSFTSEEKVLHVGLCLPHACTDDDVQKMMEETSSSAKRLTVKVEAVRSEHNKFNIWTDKTFIALSIASIIIICLLIAGTSFDYYLEHMKVSKMKEKNCVSFNGKLDITDMKAKNGKCGTYAVNNNNNISNGNNNVEHLHDFNINTGFNDTSESREPMIKMIMREMLLAFSVRMNINYIFDQSVGSDTLSVIHGLKAISMAWVILGHTCILAFKYSDNMEFRRVVQKEFMFQTITNGTYSVDTFFFSSGLLVSFLYFRTNAKGKLDTLNKGNGFVAGFLHFIGLVAYRFARLTVPYLFAVGVVEVSMKWFTFNSIFEPPTLDHENCPKYWWRNVLYINTLFPAEEMCMLWSWYLSDDTQFYVIGAVMLILATSHFKSAAGLLVAFIMSSLMTTGYVAYANSYIPGSDDPLALFDKIYDKPWTRLSPYLIGMCTGWFLFKKNCRVHMSKFIVAFGWLASSAILLAMIYGLYEVRLAPWVGAAYSALSHSAWAIALSWIVVACVTGYGGFVDKILSATVLYPFSRVTYCAYLVHPITIRIMVMSMDSPLHLGSIVTVIIYFGQMVASFLLAFFVSIMYESPIVSLLRIISKVFTNDKGTSHRAARA
ncbi:nose resistant to fluoxetine protein 6 [Leptinotarsa decemlineata]|uniref:nose resistant to fluoxetine protein 6 n=1 Tax=Leptinotarsa decemlineata TaxID=7539 RepID=UPI003D308B9B